MFVLFCAGACADADIEAAKEQARREALEEMDLLQRINPFAMSHHSDSLSAFSPTGAMRFPPDNERTDFKAEVARFYGLNSKLKGMVYNMLGELVPFSEATLAYIWPASYTNWGDACEALALPGEFYKEPRNYLLLPKAIHDAFDHGHLIFTPSKRHITIRIIKHSRFTHDLTAYDGKRLHIQNVVKRQKSPC